MKQTKELHPEFLNEVSKLTPDQLKTRIVQLQQGLKESEEHEEANDTLEQAKESAKAARELVKELSEPYKEVKAAVKLKTAHILKLLKERV